MTRRFPLIQRQLANAHQMPRRCGSGKRQYEGTDRKVIRCVL